MAHVGAFEQRGKLERPPSRRGLGILAPFMLLAGGGILTLFWIVALAWGAIRLVGHLIL